MVQPKRRIVGTAEHIHRHRAHQKMPRAVHAPRRLVEHPVEAREVIAAPNQRRHVARPTVRAVGGTQVARQAARVVPQPVQRASRLQPDRPEVDLELVRREGAGVHAPPARRGGEHQRAAVGNGNRGVSAVGDEDAVASHGPRRAVEHGRLARVGAGQARVPVRLRAGVVAFGPQGRLVEVHEPAVEAEEQPVVVHEGGLGNVGPDEIVKAGDGARSLGWGRFAGRLVMHDTAAM